MILSLQMSSFCKADEILKPQNTGLFEDFEMENQSCKNN